MPTAALLSAEDAAPRPVPFTLRLLLSRHALAAPSPPTPFQVVGAVGFSDRRLQLPDDLDPQVLALVNSCFEHQPVNRPSFAQILALLVQLKELQPSKSLAAARNKQ